MKVLVDPVRVPLDRETWGRAKKSGSLLLVLDRDLRAGEALQLVVDQDIMPAEVLDAMVTEPPCDSQRLGVSTRDDAVELSRKAQHLLAERLKMKLLQNKWSYREMASRLGIASSTLNVLVNAGRSRVMPSTLEKFARLGVRVQDLVEPSSTPKSQATTLSNEAEEDSGYVLLTPRAGQRLRKRIAECLAGKSETYVELASSLGVTANLLRYYESTPMQRLTRKARRVLALLNVDYTDLQ